MGLQLLRPANVHSLQLLRKNLKGKNAKVIQERIDQLQKAGKKQIDELCYELDRAHKSMTIAREMKDEKKGKEIFDRAVRIVQKVVDISKAVDLDFHTEPLDFVSWWADIEGTQPVPPA